MDHRLYLPKIKIDNKTTSIINSINLAVTELTTTETTGNITELNDMIYAAATAATKEAGYSLKPIRTGVLPPKQTLWINNIQNKI